MAVQQEDYRQAVRMLFGQYDRYIRLKLEEDDSGLAGQMTGYPAGEDEVFADSFQEQMVEVVRDETKRVPDEAGNCECDGRMEPVEASLEESGMGKIWSHARQIGRQNRSWRWNWIIRGHTHCFYRRVQKNFWKTIRNVIRFFGTGFRAGM